MRIGVNIPNELHRRLEPFKAYINVSQVCRDALEDRIRCYERVSEIGSNQNIVEAIERVWEEERNWRAIVEVDWGTLGTEDAESWAEAAELEQWRHLHHRQEVIHNQGRPRTDVPPPYVEGAKMFNERMGELDSRMNQQSDQFFDWLYEEHGGKDIDAAKREYMSAWLAYTDAAWELLRQKRGEHLEERRLEMLESHQNRPGPKVPSKLMRDSTELLGNSNE